MQIQIRTPIFTLAAILALPLAGCGGADDADPLGGDSSVAGQRAIAGSGGSALSLAKDGPDACFKAAASAFGAETKVMKLFSSFHMPEDLQEYVIIKAPVGDLKSCSVEFQDPDNPNKLLRADMDVATGEFKSPKPMELKVIGDSASFRLDDVVFPLSRIDTSKIAPAVSSQAATLDNTYSSHALSGVDLTDPGPGRASHGISVSFKGRLKSNEVLRSGSMRLTTDGKVEFSNVGR